MTQQPEDQKACEGRRFDGGQEDELEGQQRKRPTHRAAADGRDMLLEVVDLDNRAFHVQRQRLFSENPRSRSRTRGGAARSSANRGSAREIGVEPADRCLTPYGRFGSVTSAVPLPPWTTSLNNAVSPGLEQLREIHLAALSGDPGEFTRARESLHRDRRTGRAHLAGGSAPQCACAGFASGGFA